MKLKIEGFSEKHIKEAAALALYELREEALHLPSLLFDQAEELIEKTLEDLAKCHYGVALREEGVLIGYLAFTTPWQGFQTSGLGVFSPLGGNAFRDGKEIQRGEVLALLLSEMSPIFKADGISTVDITRYAHDRKTRKTLVLNTFGIRSADALADLKGKSREKDASIKELEPSSFQLVQDLKLSLDAYLSYGPIFRYTVEEEARKFFDDDGKRIFAYYAEGEPKAFLAISERSECFVSSRRGAWTILGTYVDFGYRGQGIAEKLLEYVAATLKEEGEATLGTDYDTANMLGSSFYQKYFSTYTYTYHRHLDERAF